MISLHWADRRRSMAAIRALIDASRSRPTTISPFMTCWTNWPIMSLACSSWPSLRASRPSSRIWVSRSRSPASSRTTVLLLFSGFLLIGALFFLLPFFLGEAQRVRELFLGVGVFHHVLKQHFELVVAVRLREQVSQLLARVDQFAKGLDLLDHVVRLEILPAVEPQLDVHLAAVVRQLVVDPHRQARRHPGEDLVEIVAIDLDQLAVFHPRQLLRRLARKVAEDTDHEGQLLQLHRPADLDVVRDLNAGRPHPVQFLLDAFLFRHAIHSFEEGAPISSLLSAAGGGLLQPQSLPKTFEQSPILDHVSQPGVERHLAPGDRPLDEIRDGAVRLRAPEVIG